MEYPKKITINFRQTYNQRMPNVKPIKRYK